jgi:hypothetical protein
MPLVDDDALLKNCGSTKHLKKPEFEIPISPQKFLSFLYLLLLCFTTFIFSIDISITPRLTRPL